MSMLGRLVAELLGRAGGRPQAGEDPPPPPATGARDALYARCRELASRGDAELAAECYRRVLQLDPGHSGANNNLGILLQQRGEMAAAAACYGEAARLDPAASEPHINLGNLHDIAGDSRAAAHCYRNALAIDPGNAQAHCALAQALLALGEYERGWEEFEWRWRVDDPRSRPPALPGPRWDGREPLGGRRLMLYAEQGYGDAIQFVRYAPLAAGLGARVIATCDPALVRLFRTVPGIAEVVEPGSPLPAFDRHAPLMSLPRAFRTTVATIPAEVPYLVPDPRAVEAWRGRLARHGSRLKVGLAWSGRPSFVAAVMKSCPPEMMDVLAATPGFSFFSLQKRGAGGGEEAPAGRAIVDFTREFADFHDTAAFIAALDVVISIDTAVAHLAGALGRPVWVMLAAVPDWRWLPQAGALRWYPSARLFRQPRPGQWAPVVAEIQRALGEMRDGAAAP
ncbi:MAG: glycosyltransferase family protein [Burkholderiales bacterium]|nr:glycosyltransferase family protein [Burkholderiales bacterium]